MFSVWATFSFVSVVLWNKVEGTTDADVRRPDVKAKAPDACGLARSTRALAADLKNMLKLRNSKLMILRFVSKPAGEITSIVSVQHYCVTVKNEKIRGRGF